MSLYAGYQMDPEPIDDVDNPYAYPDWEKTLVEPDTEFLAQTEDTAEMLIESVEHPETYAMADLAGLMVSEDGVEDVFLKSDLEVEDEPKQTTQSELNIPLQPSIVPDPEVVQRTIFQLNLREQNLFGLKEEELRIQNALVDFKQQLFEKELAAQENWDKKANAPINPSLPWNDGSNDAKRAVINRQIFAPEYGIVETYEDVLRETRRRIRIEEAEQAIWTNHWRYYRWHTDFVMACLH